MSARPPHDERRQAGFVPVFAWGLRRVVRWRKVLLVGVLAVAGGVLIGWLVHKADDPAAMLARVLDRGVLTVGLPLIALLLAGEAYAFEVQSRTLVYHLVRPVSRATVFLARFFSGYLPAALVAAAFLTAIYVASGVAFSPRAWGSVLVSAGLGVLALGAIYYTLAALLKHGLVAGLIYTFVVETLVSSVPGSMQKLSVMFQVRSLSHWLTAGVLPAVPPPKRRSMFDLTARAIEDSSPTEAAVALLLIAGAVLAFGVWRVRRQDFALKD